VDAESLKTVMECDCKVELLVQWINQTIVDGVSSGMLNIAPPLLTRAFQELSNGMVAFRGAIRISTIPFPFPYAQTCDILLILHWLSTPLVVAQWVSSAWSGLIFSFLAVFIYWCLNMIALELENPFGNDPNDIDAGIMQQELNRHLALLLQPSTLRSPRLNPSAATSAALMRRDSLIEIWQTIQAQEGGDASFGLTRSIWSRHWIRHRSSRREDVAVMLDLSDLRELRVPNSRSPPASSSREVTPKASSEIHDSCGRLELRSSVKLQAVAEGSFCEPGARDCADAAATEHTSSLEGPEESGQEEELPAADEHPSILRELSGSSSDTASTDSFDDFLPRQPPASIGGCVGLALTVPATSSADNAVASRPRDARAQSLPRGAQLLATSSGGERGAAASSSASLRDARTASSRREAEPPGVGARLICRQGRGAVPSHHPVCV